MVYRSLFQTMTNLVEERTELVLEELDIKSLQVQVNKTLTNSQLSIDTSFFQHPEKAQFLIDIQPAFVQWLKTSGLSEADVIAISQRLPTYFTFAIHQEWGNRSQDYSPLQEQLDTPFTQANERTQAWFCYSSWLQKHVTLLITLPNIEP